MQEIIAEQIGSTEYLRDIMVLQKLKTTKLY